MCQYKIRNQKIISILASKEIKTIIDFGCGDGKLIDSLSHKVWPKQISGVDISKKRINKIQAKHADNSKICTYCQSFFEYNSVFSNFEAIILAEVIEHLPPTELKKLFNLIFLYYKPKLVIITTPNRSYNVNFEILHHGLRHSSHFFELSEDDIKIFISEMKETYSNYNIINDYCDENRISHLVIAERIVTNE